MAKYSTYDPATPVSGDKILFLDGSDTVTSGDADGSLKLADFDVFAGSTLAVEEDGVEVIAEATRINFTGDGVTVTDSGAGEVEVAITGSGGGGTVPVPLKTFDAYVPSATVANNVIGAVGSWQIPYSVVATEQSFATLNGDGTVTINEDGNYLIQASCRFNGGTSVEAFRLYVSDGSQVFYQESAGNSGVDGHPHSIGVLTCTAGQIITAKAQGLSGASNMMDLWAAEGFNRILITKLEAQANVPQIVEATASRDFATTDAGNFVDYNSASAGTLTIPADDSGFATAAIIGGGQVGAGALTIAAAVGIDLNGVDGGSCTLTGQWSEFSLRKRAAGVWIISGDHGGVA